MEKTYSILIQFGDGKPVASSIRAKNGCDAQDKALVANPGARSIRITGVLKEHPSPPRRTMIRKEQKPVVHPLFTDVTTDEVDKIVRTAKDQLLQQCQELSLRGLSHRAIARQLNIGHSTVQRWLSFTRSH